MASERVREGNDGEMQKSDFKLESFITVTVHSPAVHHKRARMVY